MNEKRLQQLRVVYGIALAFVALTMLASSLMMQVAIDRNRGDSRVINLSGRQRMLSQRLTKCVLALEHLADDQEKRNRLQEVRESFVEWRAAHAGLQHGDANLGLPARRNSAEITALFATMEPFHAAMVKALAELLAQTEDGLVPEASVHATAYVLLRNEPQFLRLMDNITFQFDREARTRIGSMQKLEWAILAAGLLTLLIEFLFVFHPSITQLTTMMVSLKQQAAQLETELAERKRMEAVQAELEEQNRQLQKAESLGRMAGAVAHHFNNQLQSVTGNLEMAMDEERPGTPAAEALADALDAARRAAKVSTLMLTYLGQTPRAPVSLNLTDACRQNLPALEVAKPKQVNLLTDLAVPGPIIHADATQIRQLLTNLVTNAWEAIGKDQGEVRLTVGTAPFAEVAGGIRQPLTWQPQQETYAYVQVADTGCGIPIELRDKLFDPFFTTKFPGRGLGLAVVLGIVKAHKGVITVQSKPGEGSVFRVFFPTVAQPATS